MDTFRLLGCVSVFAVTATVALDRGWFGAPRELWSARAEQARLDGVHRAVSERHQFNRVLLGRLAAGHVSLEYATRVALEVNGGDSGYMAWLRATYPTDQIEMSVAQNVLTRMYNELRDKPDRRAAVLARLDREYTDWFGYSPPPPR
jgi:hypothetical protein